MQYTYFCCTEAGQVSEFCVNNCGGNCLSSSFMPSAEAAAPLVASLVLHCGSGCGSVRACVHAKSLQSCLILCNPMDCSLPGSLSMGFSRQEYWSGLPCPPPGDLPDPGMDPGSPAFHEDSLPLVLLGKPLSQGMFLQTSQRNVELFVYFSK